MKIPVYLDSNVWNLFFAMQLDLEKELPSSEFALAVVRQVEIEARAISNIPLRSYIEQTMEQRDVLVDAHFGFYDELHSADMQRVVGFGGGTWASEEELNVYRAEALRDAAVARDDQPRQGIKKSGLFKHEADVALAARSFHSIVLTLDAKDALKRALESGGAVVSLCGLKRSGLSLRAFLAEPLEKFLQKRSSATRPLPAGKNESPKSQADG
jgi:hypothetical protein